MEILLSQSDIKCFDLNKKSVTFLTSHKLSIAKLGTESSSNLKAKKNQMILENKSCEF